MQKLDVGVFHDMFRRVKWANIGKLKFPLCQVSGFSTIGQNLIMTNMCRHFSHCSKCRWERRLAKVKQKHKQANRKTN